MPDPTRLHMRFTPADRALLDRLAARYGMTESGLIRWAIRYLDEHGPMQGRGGRDEGDRDDHTDVRH